uniref:Programmed cell death 5 n=1 Tax=Urocitellus parryii TaxID=9999 RepID=A0A8D2I520_UROPR
KSDEILETLRKQRLAKLQVKHRDPGDATQEAKHKGKRNEKQYLGPSSRSVSLGPLKTKAIENYLVQMARYRQLNRKVLEQGLIEILEKVIQQTKKKTTVKFNRRKVMDSDEDDND